MGYVFHDRPSHRNYSIKEVQFEGIVLPPLSGRSGPTIQFSQILIYLRGQMSSNTDCASIIDLLVNSVISHKIVSFVFHIHITMVLYLQIVLSLLKSNTGSCSILDCTS